MRSVSWLPGSLRKLRVVRFMVCLRKKVTSDPQATGVPLSAVFFCRFDKRHACLWQSPCQHYRDRVYGVWKDQGIVNLRVPTILKLFWAAIKGWSKDDVPRLGASLAYYTLFAIGPILVIAIAIAGMVYGPEAVRGQIVGEISGLIGRQGAEAVQSILQSAHQSRTGFAVVIGTVALLLGASGAFLELQHALNTLFRVKTDPKKSGLERLLLSRLRSFGMVVSIGFL